MSKFYSERFLAILVVAALLVSSPAVLVSTVSAQDSAPQELRATTVTGTLTGGEFAKIWLALEPSFPEADVTVQADWDRPNALSNGVGFYLLDEVGLNLVLGGDQVRDVSLAAGDNVFEGSDNQMDANFKAFGLSNYTVVLFNDSDTDANFTLNVTNATVVDGSGQVKDPTAPIIDATAVSTDTVAIDEPAAVEAAPAAAVAEETTTVEADVVEATPAEDAPTTTAPVASGVVRAAMIEGVLPVDSATHYIGLEPNGRDFDLELVMSIDPQDNNEVLRRVNFFVIRESDLTLLGGSTQISDIAIAAGNRRVGRATNERVANFLAAGEAGYTILIQNTSLVEASYKLTVDQGVLIDDSGQTQTAQQSAVITTTDVPAEDAPAAAAAPAASTTTAPAAAAPATTAPATTAEVTTDVTSGDTYTVKSGDTISVIARDQLGNLALWRQLCAFNNLGDCNRVEVGDVINLPTQAELDALGDGTSSTPSTTTSAAPAASAADTTAADTTAADTTEPDTAAADTADETATDDAATTDDSTLGNIIETARASEDFNLLMAAIEAAGLVNALQGDEPFTVFAPTDQAFASLPEGTLDDLLDDPGGQLTSVLLYHVLPGSLLAEGLSNGLNAQTVEGNTVRFTVDGDSISINDANIIVSDVEASNGVIHVIDAVISPPSSGATTATDDAAASATDDAAAADTSADSADSTEGGNLIDRLPVLADAANLASDTVTDGTAVSYTTESTIAEAASFYENEMDRLGFTATTSVVTDQAATFTFESGDDSVRVSITPDTSSDGVLITITA